MSPGRRLLLPILALLSASLNGSVICTSSPRTQEYYSRVSVIQELYISSNSYKVPGGFTLVTSLCRFGSYHHLVGKNTMLRFSGWILWMNVPAAMAKTTWPEGTTGIFSLMNLLLTSVVVFMAMGGTLMFLYRKTRGLPPKPTRGKILQGNLRAALWLEYVAWSGSGVETHHTLQEAATLRIRDLENQLFEEPVAPRPFFSALFCHFFPSSTSSVSSSSISSIDDNGPNRSNTPERPHISQPQISTTDGSGSATTKDDGKIATHDSISSAQSAGPSRMSTANKIRESAQLVITPPPKAHPATLTNENKSPELTASHSYVFSPSVEDYPTRPARTRSHHRTSSNSHASSNIYPSLGLD